MLSVQRSLWGLPVGKSSFLNSKLKSIKSFLFKNIGNNAKCFMQNTYKVVKKGNGRLYWTVDFCHLKTSHLYDNLGKTIRVFHIMTLSHRPLWRCKVLVNQGYGDRWHSAYLLGKALHFHFIMEGRLLVETTKNWNVTNVGVKFYV